MGDASTSLKLSGSGEKRRLLTRLYGQHFLELQNYVRQKFGIGPPEPEDVAQAAFAKLASTDFQGGIENHRAFLYATARNIVSDHHRRQRTIAAHASDVASRAAQEILYDLSPERVLISKERCHSLLQGLQQLTATQRRLIYLSRVEGLSYGKIGRQTGMSAEAVRKQIDRGLARCLEHMQASQRDVSGESK